MPHWIGIDFGATNLRGTLVDLETGKTGPILRSSTPAFSGPDAILQALGDLILQVQQLSGSPNEIQAVGIGCPAAIDLTKGILLNAPNLPGDWPAIPFKARLEERLKIPVYPINDVRAITLGEFTFGAGKGADTLACIAIGTGIGGGVVTDGRLHLGISGSAGEFGHLIVDPNGPACNCGSRGCLETIASGTAITAKAVGAVAMRKPTLISDLAGGDMNRISTVLVIEAARKNDPVARSILEEAGIAIGIAVSNILVTIAPTRILIGGGASAAGDLILEPIRRTVREHTFMVPVEQVEIIPTSLGDSAGLLGAALWASDHFSSGSR